MRRWRWLIWTIGIWVLAGTGMIVAAQGDPACGTALVAVWTAASDACVGKPSGYVCNGGAIPAVEPAGAVSSSLSSIGALVEAAVVDSLHAPGFASDGVFGGVVWLRVPDPIPMTGLLLGNVSVADVSPPDFAPWQSLVVQTSSPAPESTCALTPRSSFIAQSLPNTPVRTVINGVSIDLNGTLVIQTGVDVTHFIALAGQSSLLAFGQSQLIRPGQQVSIPHTGSNFAQPANVPGIPAPLDPAAIQNIPVALFDRTVNLPQPGYVATEGQVNLRSAPSAEAGLIMQVPAGQVMSILGQNAVGDWYHVRLDSGETGWMKAELLVRNIGAIQAVYEATPLPPQRYGTLGRTARVLAPAGVNLRQAPDIGFPAIAALADGTPLTLVARSPYSPWVKVEVSGLTGWLALITIQTEAVIDALPIDYNVPPPPPPTVVPGSFGNAFPDPRATDAP